MSKKFGPFACHMKKKEDTAADDDWYVKITPPPVVKIEKDDEYPAEIVYSLKADGGSTFPGEQSIADPDKFPFKYEVSDHQKKLTITIKQDDPKGDYAYSVCVRGKAGIIRDEDPEIHNDGP